jgi:hypothetical protein
MRTGARILVVLLATLAGGPAAARRPTRPPDIFDLPVGANVGAGVAITDFDGNDLRRHTDAGVAWDVRFYLGTRTRHALEVAYTGSLQEIDALGLDTRALLLGTGLEVDARVNLSLDRVQPFVYGGLGVRRFSIVNAQSNFSDMAPSDVVLDFPFGAGLSVRAGRAVIELRLGYRPTLFEDLAPGDWGGDADLEAWSVGLRAGFDLR